MFLKEKQDLVKKFIMNKECPSPGIFFEITRKCNLKCRHCRVVEINKKMELSYREICNIIDQLAEIGCFYIDFTGGEPLMRRDFFNIAIYTRRKKMTFIIHTNGSLITSSIADRIADLHPLEIYIPFLGLREETDDRLRGRRGIHKKVIRAVKLLEERGVRTRLTLVVMKQNATEMIKAKEFVQKIGGSSWYFLPLIHPRIDGSESPLICRASDSQLEQIGRFIPEWRIDTTSFVSSSDFLDYPVCTAGKQASIITAYGEFNPCFWFPDKNNTRNLREKTLFQIWKSDPKFKKLASLKNKDLPICKNCNLRIYCNPCPALSFFEKRNITLPSSEICRTARIRKGIFEKGGKNE